MEYTTEFNAKGGFRFDIHNPPEAVLDPSLNAKTACFYIIKCENIPVFAKTLDGKIPEIPVAARDVGCWAARRQQTVVLRPKAANWPPPTPPPPSTLICHTDTP